MFGRTTWTIPLTLAATIASELFLTISGARADSTLRFAAASNWAAPFGEYGASGELTGGMVLQIIRAISEEARLPWRVVTMPRQRIDDAGRAGEIDVRCYAKPEWTNYPDEYLWSEPIFVVRDLVIGRRGAADVTGYNQMKGRSLATALGYRYPAIESELIDRGVIRHPAPSERNVAMMVALGRSDFGIVTDIALNHLKRIDPGLADIEATRLTADRNEIRCGVSKQLDAPRSGAVLSAVAYLRAKGEFLRIVEPTQ